MNILYEKDTSDAVINLRAQSYILVNWGSLDAISWPESPLFNWQFKQKPGNPDSSPSFYFVLLGLPNISFQSFF